MYYVAGDGTHLYASHSLAAAKSLAATMKNGSVEEFAANEITIDFGGILLGSMKRLKVAPRGHNYQFLAHHLTQLAQALNTAIDEAKGLKRDFVSFLGHPLGHCMELATAEAMMHSISEHWNEFVDAERHNLDAWEGAIRSISSLNGVDVKREIDLIDKARTEGN